MTDIEKLVEKAVTGDTNAYTELYKLSYRQIYFTCFGLVKNKNDAEDLTQESFLIIMKKLPKLKEKDKFQSWIKTITINNCKKFLNKSNDISCEEKFDESSDKSTNEEFTLPDEYIENQEKRKIIMDIIMNSLTDVQRQTIILFYYNQMTVTEISIIMNCSSGTVSTRLKSAKKILKKEILKYEEISNERLHLILPVPFLTTLLNTEADKTEPPGAGIPNFDIPSAIQTASHISSASTLTTTATNILGTKGIAIITATVVGGGGIGYYFYETHDNENKKDNTEVVEEITYTTTADNTALSDEFIFTYPVTETSSTFETTITTTVSVTEKTTSETSSTSTALTTSTNASSSTTTKITTQTSGTVAAVTTPVFLAETTTTTAITTSSEVTSSSLTTTVAETQTEIVTSATLPSNASYADDKIDVSYGYSHSAYIDTNGTLYMYGSNESGQLGDGTTEDRTEPVAIMEDVKFNSVYLGNQHSAAISEDGSLYTWGLNDCGQLGNGTTENSSVPVKIMENVKSASVSDGNTIALTEDGTLYTFGKSIDDPTNPITSPTKVLENVKYADVGISGYAAITEEGKLYTWGLDTEAAINGTMYDNQWIYEPQLIMEDLTFVSAQQSDSITGALTDSGDLYIWGYSTYGNLGINASYSYEPVKVMENVKYFSIGTNHSGAITTDGSLYTWGSNAQGQLGADVGSLSRTPVIVMEGTKFVSLKLSYYHTSAITEDNIEYCWGKN